MPRFMLLLLGGVLPDSTLFDYRPGHDPPGVLSPGPLRTGIITNYVDRYGL
jgi:hypothetical protein